MWWPQRGARNCRKLRRGRLVEKVVAVVMGQGSRVSELIAALHDYMLPGACLFRAEGPSRGGTARNSQALSSGGRHSSARSVDHDADEGRGRASR